MKKYMVLCAGLSLAMVFASCGKSSESAYKKAYEKAKSQEAAQTITQQPATPAPAPVVTPVQTQPATQTTVVAPVNDKDVRSENVQLVNGTGLKAYSVVVGSFKGQANAEGLQQQLRNNGYDAQVVRKDAVDGAWFRVIATTFDNKLAAISSRDALRATYQGAWLLFKQ
jgi:cell division protein FtsN